MTKEEELEAKNSNLKLYLVFAGIIIWAILSYYGIKH